MTLRRPPQLASLRDANVSEWARKPASSRVAGPRPACARAVDRRGSRTRCCARRRRRRPRWVAAVWRSTSPSLAAVDPHQFGMAIASCDGQVHVIGDADVPFSVQSISKVFTLALVVAAEGENIWKRVSREPSGNPFNSLLQLDQEAGRPRNPFVNAGALVVTDRLHSLTGDAQRRAARPHAARERSRRRGQRPGVARSELDAGHRTSALAHLLASSTTSRTPSPR